MVAYKGGTREEPNLTEWEQPTQTKEERAPVSEHLPGCNSKTCWEMAETALIKAGALEQDAPHYRAARMSREAEAITNKLSVILRQRARRYGLKMTKKGYVRLRQLLEHPLMRMHKQAAVEKVVRQDEERKYQIVRGDDEELHIRAVYGHALEMRIDAELPKVEVTDLPNKLANYETERAIHNILRQGILSWGKQHVILSEAIPKPGERHHRAPEGKRAVYTSWIPDARRRMELPSSEHQGDSCWPRAKQMQNSEEGYPRGP